MAVFSNDVVNDRNKLATLYSHPIFLTKGSTLGEGKKARHQGKFSNQCARRGWCHDHTVSNPSMYFHWYGLIHYQ